jgi:hypothetical protein
MSVCFPSTLPRLTQNKATSDTTVSDKIQMRVARCVWRIKLIIWTKKRANCAEDCYWHKPTQE